LAIDSFAKLLLI